MNGNRWASFRWLGPAVLLLIVGISFPATAQTPAGYSEYYIPAEEGTLYYALTDLDGGAAPSMHTVISVVAWTDNTTVYYDHWENGYNFLPANPLTADETYTLAKAGDRLVFESANLVIPRTAASTCNIYRNGTLIASNTTTCYDGGDRIYAAGGTITVTRAGGREDRWAGNQADAWEVYPVKPQLTTYVLPFGEDLFAADPVNYFGFERVYVLIQATADNTTFTVDLNGDGTPDVLNLNRDNIWNNTTAVPPSPPLGFATDAATVTLSRGQTFLLDRISACRLHVNCVTAPATLNSGAVITGSATLQVKFMAGRAAQTYVARGFSAFPRGYWTTDYYAPFGQGTTAGRNTDYYLYNPQASTLRINWQSLTGSGFLDVTAGATRSFRQAVGAVPVGSGLYFSASAAFWGVGVGDSGDHLFEWGFSLLPSTMLYKEHYLGWAPGSLPVGTAPRNGNGIFLSVAQDNTRVFVDTNGDGVPDQTYTLNRLQTQFISDPTDGDLLGAHFWATGPFTMAYGENPDTATTPTPNLDLGYVAIPSNDFTDLVLGVTKSVNPVAVSTAANSTSTYKLTVSSAKYAVNSVVDNLPPNWAFVANSAVITLPNFSVLGGAGANPTITGTGPYTLTWPSSLFAGGMAENQQIVITYTAQTTAVLATGTLSQNRVTATATRTVGAVTQTFNAADFTFNVSGALQITKTSSAPTPVYPGNQFTYTVTVTSPAGNPAQTRVSLYDPQPAGVTAVAGSTTLSRSNVADAFSAQLYTNSDGSRAWGSNWIEGADTGGGAVNGSATQGDIQITATGELRLDNSNSTEPTISRAVNTAGATAGNVFLAFNYRTDTGVVAADHVYVQAGTNGTGGAFTTVGDITGIVGATSGTQVIDISAYIGANTAIRFTFPNGSYQLANEFFYVDNVAVTYNVSVTTGGPPELASLYTLAAGQSLVATFNVTVSNPLPTGQSAITNTASTASGELPVPVSASVTNLVIDPTIHSATVAGRVWLDTNNNAVQNVGEPGISNVEMTLKDQFGTPVAVTTTDVNGRYLFDGVAPGNGYYVEATYGLPSGLTQTYPVGQTNNRSVTFNLTRGQSYTGADLGYKPTAGTIAIGDLVWVDANANGIHDAGEVGLGGATIRLYADTNGNGVRDAGDATVATTTSAPNGSYLFTGVAPSTTSYFVEIVTAPVGYTSTTATSYRFPSTTANNAYLTADFGFNSASTLSIKDRVWFDASADGTFNSGTEYGIGGVTVDLLDSSLRVIATTTTSAADGTFTFSGLAGGGAAYTVRITDAAGVLANYYGTTSYATARKRVEVNLPTSVDRTTSTPFGSYGFNITRSIGDTVYYDANGNGAQDAGENGIPGIVVSLYTDNVGTIGSITGETLLGTVTTDAAGHYLFTGLADGNYVVSVPDQTGYTFRGPGTDSDGTNAGIQKTATISGAGNVLTVDYGFQPTAAPGSLAGRLWNDTNRNGVINAGEAPFAGVTLDILLGSPGTTVVASVTTDASGNYSTTGLALGTYTVRVTDRAGLLTGFNPTYEKTEGTTSPFNQQEAVVLSAGTPNAVGVNFGYVLPVPTRASISSIRAFVNRRGVVVEWNTSIEVGTVGFHLLRHDAETGEYVQVNERLLPALFGEAPGGRYTFPDPTAPVRDGLTYKLVEMDAQGTSHEYGPWILALGGWEETEPYYQRTPRTPDIPRVDLAELRATEPDAAMTGGISPPAEPAQPGTRLKIRTSGAGIVTLDAGQIAPALGIPDAELLARIENGKVALTNSGKDVPYLPQASGLLFHAVALASPYTEENVYWLEIRSGKTMPSSASPPAAGPPAPSYPDTLHAEQDRYPVPVFFQDPAANFWCWDYLYAGTPGYDTKSFKVQVPGPSRTGRPSLTVNLQGGSDTPTPVDHHVRVAWNGRTVGEATWDGTTPYRLVVPLAATDLIDGENTLSLTALLDSGAPYSLVYLASFDLTYDRLYQAVNDELAFTVPAGSQVNVSGFSSPLVVVLDVTDPASPAVVTGIHTFSVPGGAASLNFANRTSTKRSYRAVVVSNAKQPVGTSVPRAPYLTSSATGASYLLVAPASLVSAARTLAAYRQGQGLDTLVVDLESVYNEFSDGIATPLAIRDLLRFAARSWRKGPAYVTLVGRGTWDYKNRLGAGDNLLPTLLVTTPYGLAVSDAGLLDLQDGDAVVSIGRLPVVTAQDLLDYVAKVKAREGTPILSGPPRVLMTADDPDAGGSFTTDSDTVAAAIPSGYQVDRVYLGTMTAAAGTQAIVSSLNAGAVLFNYLGHGGPDRLADENLFRVADVPTLTSTGVLPFFSAMTCSAGNFGIPGFRSLGEAMLLSKAGGAWAVFAPSGLSLNSAAVTIDKEVFRLFFANAQGPVGDVTTKAVQVIKTGDPSVYMRSIYNLLGEPVSKLP